LGSIFSNNNPEKEKEKEKENTSSKDESENENDESIDYDIINLFSENQTNKNFENDVEKINSIIKNISFITDKEKALLNQLMASVEDYQDTFNFLIKKKENFSNELKDFNDLTQKLRSSKNIEGEIDEIISKADQFGILPNTFKQQESFLRKKRDVSVANAKSEIGITEENKKINKDLPWNANDNFVVMNL
jgi:hypothetical protein